MSSIEVSVVIATRNRPAILSSSMEKALEASRGLPVEIIIVNDGDPLTTNYQNEPTIRVFKNPSTGVASARNYGVKQSNGKTIFFIDDDMWINRNGLDWVITNLSIVENEKFVFNLNWEYPNELEKRLLSSKIGKYILASNYNSMWGRMHVSGQQPSSGLYRFFEIASCSLVMNKELFNGIGGYKEDFIFQGEDTELSIRLVEFDIPIFCVFDVLLFHNHSDRLDVKGYLDRERRGFESQFKGELIGLIPKTSNNYKGFTRLLFHVLRMSESLLISTIKLLPNNKFLTPFSNKLIGILTSLQSFKEWRKVSKKYK